MIGERAKQITGELYSTLLIVSTQNHEQQFRGLSTHIAKPPCLGHSQSAPKGGGLKMGGQKHAVSYDDCWEVDRWYSCSVVYKTRKALTCPVVRFRMLLVGNKIGESTSMSDL